LIPTAFLILAHQQPRLLGRLARRLGAPGTHIFIHVDARAPLEDFKAAVGDGPDHTFLEAPDRLAPYWGGFTMVEATQRLLRRAFAAPATFERFFLLSGVDYPIKPIGEIGRALEGDVEILQVDRQLVQDGTGPFDRCANQLFLGDSAILNSRTGAPVLRNAARFFERATRRRWPAGLRIYQGPSWWCLTRDAVSAFLDVWDEPDSYIPWFRLSRSPAEMVFQTVLAASARRDHIKRDFTRVERPPGEDFVQGAHYVDWRAPRRKAPVTLRLGDLPALLASEALFARKLDLVQSAGLMDALDAVHG